LAGKFPCKGKTLLVIVNKLIGFKSSGLQKFVDNPQQCFVFTPQANFEFSLKMEVMGSNPGYLVKSYLL